MSRKALIAVVAALLAHGSTAYALSGGPLPPEVLQFEPADTTDLVELATGNFVYNLPLLSVPGPAGDYPINLSYHSGIGPNEEGSWVGLGWSLHPGAVTRTVSGYPDDYVADYVQTHFATDALRGFGVGIGVGYGPVGMNVSYDSYTGRGGVNFFATLGYALADNVRVGFTGTVGSGGIGGRLGATASYGGLSAELAASANSTGAVGLHGNVSLSGAASVGFTLSTEGSGANYSVAGVGFSSMAAPSGGTFDSFAVNFSIPLPYFWLSLAYSHWTWRLDETYDEKSYGYLYQSSYLADPATPDATRPDNKKYERHKQGRFLFASQDLYQVSAQGLAGVFTPFARRGYTLVDWSANEYKAVLAETDVNRNPRDDMVFRFLGDPGANLIGAGAGDGHVNLFADRFASKLIAPGYQADGKIGSFTITDADGKQYRFAKPVHNYLTYSWSRAQDNLNSRSYTLMATPYAAAWLLTEIRGPDFVDRDGDDAASRGDWGYWIRFRYSTEPLPNVWRSPYTGMNPGLTPERPQGASFGLSELVFLEQVETASHVALFRTSLRKDRMTANLEGEDLTLQGKFASTIPDLVVQAQNSYEAEVDFDGKWKTYFDALPPDTVAVRVEETRILVTNNRVDMRYSAVRDLRKADILQCSQVGNRVRFRFAVDQADIDADIGSGALPYSRFERLERVQLIGNNLIPAPFQIAKRLDRIDVYSKSDSAVTQDATSGNWVAAGAAVPIRSAALTYDYSLAAGTPNSAATRGDGASHGRLTLKSVTVLGLNGVNAIPPYRFEYAGGAAPGALTAPNANPVYYANGWDQWGSYRYPILDDIFSPLGDQYRHDTPQQETYADYAAAWSLTKVTLPTGGAIEVAYESDDYYHVADTVDLRLFVPQGVDGTQVRPLPADKFPAIAPAATRNTFTVPKQAWSGAAPTPGEYIAIVGAQYIPTTGVSSPPRIYLDAFAIDSVQSVIEGGVDKYRVSFAGRTYTFAAGRNYFVARHPRRVYGGGVRVAQLTSRDGDARYVTRYRYETEDGRSSGVTASLHQVSGIPLDVRRDTTYGYRLFVGDVEIEKHEDLEPFTKLFIDYPKSFRRPAPGVIYERVEVFNAAADGEPLNGKTVFRFFTAKDRPYQIDDSATGAMLRTYDPSGLYGKPKSVEYFEQTPTGFRTVRRLDFDYLAGEELTTVGRVYDSRDADVTVRLPQEGTSTATRPLGLVQESYSFYDHEGSDQVKDQLRRHVVRSFPSFFAIATRTTDHHFGSSDVAATPQTRSQKTRNIIWDAASGLPLAQAATTSDGRVRIAKATPAYWRYPSMATRNMLKQTAQETLYLATTGIDDVQQLRNYAFAHQDIVASEVKTWQAWTQAEGVSGTAAVWRENDTYRYVKALDLSDGAHHPFFDWQYSSNTFTDEAASRAWHMTSNISAYDRYSRPVEEARRDGALIAALFAEDAANPIAVAQRASRREIFYFDFETPDGLNTLGTASTFFGPEGSGRTGLRAFNAYASASPWYRLQGLKAQTPYRLSFWVRQGTATIAHPVRIGFAGPGMANVHFPVLMPLAPTTDWQLVSLLWAPVANGDVELHLDLEPRTGTGGLWHSIDDLRIHPVEATMRTFTYTPLTRQVSSSTDENSVTTYYEYDPMWRLQRVRDQRRNIVKQYDYHYRN